MDSDTVNKRNLIKQVSLIFLFSFYNQKFLRSYIYIGIIEKEKRLLLLSLGKSGYYRLKGVSRRQGYET